jgi:ketosteroid isomerase-like protein
MALLAASDRRRVPLIQSVALSRFYRDQEMWRGAVGEVVYLVNVMWPLPHYMRDNGATSVRGIFHFHARASKHRHINGVKGKNVEPSSDLQSVADRQAVRDVHDEYYLRLEFNDFEGLLDLFTDDAVYEVSPREHLGREEVAATLSQAPHGTYLCGGLRIMVDGDTAETVQSYAFLGDDEHTSNSGWYYRTLIRTDAGWKILRTRTQIHKRSLFARMLPPTEFAG